MRVLTRRATRGLVAIGAAMVTTIGFSAGPASAAVSQVVVSGGVLNGSFSASTGNAILTDLVTGREVYCHFSAGPEYSGRPLANGTYTASPPLPRVATITSASLLCAVSFTFTGTPKNLPWSLNATGPTLPGGWTPASISGIIITLSGPCTATLAGTSATTPGTAAGFYTNAGSSSLKLNGGGDLHFWNTVNCVGYFGSGNPATLVGDFAVTPSTLKFVAS